MREHPRAWLIASSILAIVASTSANASENNVQGQDKINDNYSLTDIVVTAQRREESLQSVPVAVTALNADALAQMRIANVGNLSGAAPNLQVNTQGIQSTPLISIRGITSGSSNNGVDPKVGIYLNGVYIGRSVGAVFDLADIERIEVLRGPQGTLFGRNATSGAISIITSAPTGEFGVKQDLSYGSLKAFRSRTVLNLPALGPLSVKASYLHDEIRGDVENLIGGKRLDFSLREPRFGKLTFVDRMGSRNIDAVQVAARLDLNDVTIDYNFDWTDSRSSSRAVQQLGLIPGATAPLVGGINAYQPFTGGITNYSTTRLNRVANATSMEHVTVSGHNLTATWNQSDAVTVKSITAFRKLNQRPNVHDLAATGGIKFNLEGLLSFFPIDDQGTMPPAPDLSTIGPNDSVYTLLTARSTKQEQFSQELQFQLTQDAFNLVAGLYYFNEKSPAIDVLGVFQPILNGVVLPTPLDTQFGSGVLEVMTKNSSMALYGQGTVHLTDQLDISAGLRYTSDHRQTEIISTSGAQGSGLRPGVYKSNYSKINYSAIINWKPNSDLTAYAKMSTGYVAGGIMSGIPYDPENLTAYEVGIKASAANNRIRANTALFYMDYKDLQTQNFIDGVQRFDNAGKAKVKGIELELDVVPVRGLTLSGSLGYTDFDYKEFILSGVDVATVARPPYFSEWTGRLSAHFEFGEMSGGAVPFIRADGRYRSKSYLTSTPISDPVVERENTTPAYWLVDARMGIDSIPIGGSTINISAWVKNLFDEDVRNWGAPALPLTGIYDWGRTYGLDVSFKF